jgi:hypothetical protein
VNHENTTTTYEIKGKIDEELEQKRDTILEKLKGKHQEGKPIISHSCLPFGRR